MKPFDFGTPVSVHACRPATVELHGQRIALPGLVSRELLVRGCDQKAWLERLVEHGIRHVVVPLNGGDEDTSLFARRHPRADDDAAEVCYDLAHRDEGIFARIQFLIEAASQAGVLVGLSLFSLNEAGGPLNAGRNLQGVVFTRSHAGAAHSGGGRKSARGGTARAKNSAGAGTSAARLASVGLPAEAVEAALQPAMNWVGAELRGRPGVWVELFRGAELAQLPQGHRRVLEGLSVRLAKAMSRSAKQGSGPTSQGPWLALPLGLELALPEQVPVAPFRVWHGAEPQEHLPYTAGAQPVLCVDERVRTRSGRGDDDETAPRRAKLPRRQDLWRTALRGGWPLVAAEFQALTRPDALSDLSRLCRFALQWTGPGGLRPEPRAIGRRFLDDVAAGKLTAASDTDGRVFVYAQKKLGAGIDVNLPPGVYRFCWYDVTNGKGVERGDGVTGGTDVPLPAPGKLSEALLVLEHEQLPDPFANW